MGRAWVCMGPSETAAIAMAYLGRTERVDIRL